MAYSYTVVNTYVLLKSTAFHSALHINYKRKLFISRALNHKPILEITLVGTCGDVDFCLGSELPGWKM